MVDQAPFSIKQNMPRHAASSEVEDERQLFVSFRGTADSQKDCLDAVGDYE